LAEEFGVARMTIRAALAGLQRDGLIERVPGRGSYVRKPATQRPVGTLLSFHDQAVVLGKTPRSTVVSATVREASKDEVKALHPGLDPDARPRVVAIERVRYFDTEAVAIERATFPAALEPLLDADLEYGSLHLELRRLGHLPTLGSSVLTAATAADDAPHLGVDPATALLVETRTIQDQHGRPLEYTTSAYVADRYALQVQFRIEASLPD
jgi:GntR family transcriptional regulator